jgi:hypothetical protein
VGEDGRFELKSLLSLYNGMAKFIEGSPVRQSDLERCSADHAHAFFLLADPEAEVCCCCIFQSRDVCISLIILLSNISMQFLTKALLSVL